MTTLNVRLEHNDSPLQYSDSYVDLIWTPIVGSTATATLRVLSHLARLNKGNVTVSTVELSDAVGCKPARIDHAIARLGRTGLLTINGDSVTVYSSLPTAPTRCIERLTHWAIDYAHNRHSHIRPS